jgi:hypothetical protein
LRSRIATAEKLAKADDRPALTAAARKAFLDRFEQHVDPDGTLDPAERAIRAEHAKRAYFARLALKSSVARARAKQLTLEADEAEAELANLGGDAA